MQAFVGTRVTHTSVRFKSESLWGLTPRISQLEKSTLPNFSGTLYRGLLSSRCFSRTSAFQLNNEPVDFSFLTPLPRSLSPAHLLYESLPEVYDGPTVFQEEQPFPVSCSLDQLTDVTCPPVFLQGPLLSVHTADLRAAGTSATPQIRIVGEKGTLDCSLNGNFSRGSRALFAASLDHLGEIKMITVSTTEDSPSLLPTDQWLLEKIVLSVPSRDDIEFVCNEWIGNSGHPGDYDGDDCVNDKIVLFPTSPGSLSADYEWNDELHLSLGRSGVPAEEKINRGHKSVVRKNNGYAGEDAYFISYGTRRERAKEKRAFDFSMANHYYLGVADGVGMWRKEGVDSALYSQHLLHSAREVIGAHNNPDPYKVLSEAWENTTIVHGVKGSCTVCLFRVSPDGWVDGVQVGDAGLRVVRDGKIVYRTSEQEHLFGFPYQLGHISTTKPQDCIRHRFQALPGDVLVMGSDGLFDNVSDRSMASTIRDFCNLEVQNRSSVKPFNGDELSRKLVTMAYLNSVQKEQDTPWSRAAQKEWDVPISGGKEDDVVAVVARIESR